MFERSQHTFKDDAAPQSGKWYLSIDYGTRNPFCALLWRVSGMNAYCMAEYYHDGKEGKRLTDEEHMANIDKLAGSREIRRVIIDPSAASMIETLWRHKYHVHQAYNDVVPGISNTATALQTKRLMFHESCVNTIREFSLYTWDEKAIEDKPIKDNDHAMDAVRYFVQTELRFIREHTKRFTPTPIVGEHQYWTGKRYFDERDEHPTDSD